MRNMSFMLTTKQFKDKTKTVTRRNGWKHLKVGDFVQGCEKCQGLKKGEKLNKLGVIQILKTEFEPLNAITKSDCIKEGFPNMTPAEFVTFYCKHNKCEPTTPVNRIEFVHKDAEIFSTAVKRIKKAESSAWVDGKIIIDGQLKLI